MWGLNDEIETVNGYNRLNFNLEPNASIILEPSTLIHMDGKLVLEPTVFSKGSWFDVVKRGLAGQSIIDAQITNKSESILKLSVSPTLLGTINKIEILPNQVWRFTPSSFIACTNNILVSGNLNIFSNFKAFMGGQDILYTEISVQDNKPGIVWISAHGALEKHEILMGKNSHKLKINDGIFLGILAEDKEKNINYWNKYINVESANGFFKGLLTNTSLMMNIEDKKQDAPENTKCILYTQSMNIRNLQNYIQKIVLNTVSQSSVVQFGLSGGDNINKLNKYQNKYNELNSTIN
jgi:uncharacterized protein (AIM24 family)